LNNVTQEKIHFVTGKLAEQALRSVLEPLAASAGFDYTVQVMPITVAALMTPSWIAPKLEIPAHTTKIILPGYCNGDLEPIFERTTIPVERGPRDLRRLPEHFGKPAGDDRYGDWEIEIIAEINHAPGLTLDWILKLARSYRNDGATIIDLGCEPHSTWSKVADCVSMLCDQGFRVSIDSLNPVEIAAAVKAGAELVLSVNATNRQHAVDWGCEVVAIPDDIRDLDSLLETVDFLAEKNVSLRIDPILEPIGFGFAASLQRYFQARQRWPEAEMMMGIGNLTELSGVDSAGVNFLLIAICQELGIRSVLTTQVINWARSSVKECDLARRLVHYAIHQNVPPKHIDDGLVILRDSKLLEFGQEFLTNLAGQIKDNNYRIFAESSLIHLLGAGKMYSAADPFELFDALLKDGATNLDASHAFYLGFEMCKALTALQLGKQYTQDESLNWGHLTVEETTRHRLQKKHRQ
jgi:dihydropteroate synthase-like protein